MTDLESLRSLQKRIHEATGPDRELDCIVHAVMDGREIREDGNLILARSCRPPHDAYVVGSIDPGREQRNFSEGYSLPLPPHYTLDPDGLGPCVALQRAVLPGCKWERDRCGSLRIWHPDNGAGPSIVFAPANDCLTFLYAIVGALIAQEEAKENADE